MIRAFLSHSSNDKEGYVRNVAKWLQKDNIIYDEFTFEEGEQAFDEIIKGLEKTELFVLFLSNSALESKWVQKEILEAKNLFDANQISKIFPIIIEDGITYQDMRIPDWLKDNYNLKPIKRAAVAAKRIQYKLRELSWAKHPELKKRQNIFVGRNDKQEEFEERIHDFDKEKPTVIISTGLTGVGRRTFLHRALLKTNIIESSYKPISIYLDRSVSIEDFILKLNDIGLVDFGDRLLSLTSKTMDEKISLIHEIMEEAYENKEVIYIVDDGCLINYERSVTEWFLKTVNNYQKSNFPIFCIASRFRVGFKSRPRNDKFYFVELNELNPNERKRLLTQLLALYQVDISSTDFRNVLHLLFGLPEQIMYAVDLIRIDNISTITDKLPTLREYNSDKAGILLSKYEKDNDILDFIRLLAQFEIIASSFIFLFISEEKYFPILESLAAENVCELIGVDGEIIRLNDVIRDYIIRNRLKLKDEYQDAIKEQVRISVSSDDILEKNSSEYLFSIKEALKEGIEIDEKFIIPSHYLRCMKDIYYSRGSLKKIIQLADIILQKKNNFDIRIEMDIRYYLCLALAKRKDKRLLKEVQSIQGDEHSFLLGFYYRLSGRYDDSLNQLLKVVDAPYVGTRSKREIVQVYVQVEEYEKALEYAKKNYEENKGNQFHTQAYFNCLINSEDSEEHKSQLEYLIKNFRLIGSDQSNEMADISEALYYSKVEKNETKALDTINDCVAKYPENHYPLFALCDISLKYRNNTYLKSGISQLEELKKYKTISERTLNRYKAFQYALYGKIHEALQLIEIDIARYPKESRGKIIKRLKNYNKS